MKYTIEVGSRFLLDGVVGGFTYLAVIEIKVELDDGEAVAVICYKDADSGDKIYERTADSMYAILVRRNAEQVN